jgi:hypothetical protein
MGVKVYYIVVAAVMVFAAFMPQEGEKKKRYIILMFFIHAFVCAFRYPYMHGDLMKYGYSFPGYRDIGWLGDGILADPQNFAFKWLMKLISHLSGGDFQYALIVIAVISEASVAYLVYKYSNMPWLSYLLWNCVGFYIFGFYALKQILAMAFLVPAFVGIMESKPLKWFIWTLIAGAFHEPALIFLLAYPLCLKKMDFVKILLFLVGMLLIYRFRTEIVNFMTSLYYEDEKTAGTSISGVGGRFVMIAFMIVIGIIFKGFSEESFSKMFSIIIIASILQLFSRYGHIFSRLADYYFQFMIVYVPLLLGNVKGINDEDVRAVFRLHPRVKQLIIVAIVIFSLWFYRQSGLSDTSANVDNLANFKFMWEVAK